MVRIQSTTLVFFSVSHCQHFLLLCYSLIWFEKVVAGNSDLLIETIVLHDNTTVNACSDFYYLFRKKQGGRRELAVY